MLLHGDCLDLLPTLETNSVDLVCIDPPYNIGKADWDTWKNPADYIEFMGRVFLELQRVLKDNGSLYWFHNDMMQIVKLMAWLDENSEFIFKQFIVWNKRFDGYHNQIHALVHSDEIRNYPKMAEYCLFYTFQDETGLTTVKLDMNNFSTLRQYFKDYQDALGLTKTSILEKIGQQADHCFRWGSSQWDMPTAETYAELGKLPLKNEFIRREYEDLRREYEDLRREYEDLRYTFNNQKTHHSVWNYEIAKGNGHETPKPEPLIENIILHSSNEGDTVLDCFMGSGTCGAVCVQTGRNFIGIERDDRSFEYAKKRINDEIDKPKQLELIGA